MKKPQACLMAAILMTTSSCATVRELPGADMSCPSAPKCVSSEASDPRHHIEPFGFQDPPLEAMQRLKEAVLTEKRVTIIEERPEYLHAEVRSLIFRFVDDVEFTLQPEQGLIQVRSSARVGYTDFGVNRRRVERIRQIFQQ
jgi:uncharacterized protein (DUF1499 family)